MEALLPHVRDGLALVFSSLCDFGVVSMLCPIPELCRSGLKLWDSKKVWRAEDLAHRVPLTAAVGNALGCDQVESKTAGTCSEAIQR